MTTEPSAQITVEPAAPPGPEVVPGTGSASAAIHEGSGSAPRRWWRRQESENLWRNEILSRLKKPGCFICLEAETNLRRYYFWFLEEQYANVPTMERLQRAHGFCLRHTRHLLEQRTPDRISYVMGYVLRHCADWLRSVQTAESAEHHGSRANRRPASRPFHPAVGCPACEEEQGSSQLFAQVIVGCLGDAEIVRAFRHSDGLCFPHFLKAAHVAGLEALQFLTAEQIRHLDEARADLSAMQMRGTDGAVTDVLRAALARLYGPDLDKGIRPFLVAGRRPRQNPAELGKDHASVQTGPSESWSPAFEEACRLLSQPGCSLCRVVARSREEYLAWLDQEIQDCTQIRYRWDAALYLCSQHAWLFADRCAPEVLGAACSYLLGQTAEILRNLLWEIREPISPSLNGRIRALPVRWRESGQPEDRVRSRPPVFRRTCSTLRSIWLTSQNFLDRVRERILRRDPCPLCEHLERIEGRATDRLLAVIADAEGWRAFGRSYGLCLRHAPVLLERTDTPGLRESIAAVLRARVEVDHWETEEYLRKRSWNVRHEPTGTEGGAWLRASTRLAGIAMEQHYGF